MKLTPLFVAFLATLSVLAAPKLVGQTCDGMFIAADVQVPQENHLSQVEWALIKGKVIGQCFDEQSISRLAADVREVLQNIGYLHATLSAPSMTTIDSSRFPHPVLLSFNIREGDRYTVSEISIVGYRTLDADQIRSVCQFELGKFLDMNKVRASAAAIQRLYGANGSSQSKVAPQIEILKGPYIRVVFMIEEGPPTR